MKTLTLLFTIYALLFMLQPTIQGEDTSSNLAALTTKFQELITELGAGQEGSNNYENELTTMLQKLDHLSISNARDTNLSVEWFAGPTSKVNPMRVILVVSSFEGMYLNSGIGTFYASLADFLVSHGHTVTILYTRTITSDASFKIFKRWQASCERQGIIVARLDPPTVRITSPALTQKSYWVYQYLKKREQEFDVVHFPDWEGPGYFTTLAKHQGLAFISKILIVGLHGPWRWVKYGNQQALNQVEDLETDWLERRSIELADALVTPSADLPKWLAASGWSLSPTRHSPHNKLYLMPFLPGKELVMAQPEGSLSDGRITVQELVFFGRLEARKGLVLFSDALDIIHQSYPSLLGNVKVTFLGRNSKIGRQSSTSYMTMRAKQGGWSFEVNYVHHKDRKGALAYLQETGKGRVAVMPSLVDNAPYTLYECLIAHIPFVASNLASIIALVHPESREQVLFSPDPESLASSLQNIITSGAIVARSLMSIEDSVGSWESFYTAVSSWRQGDQVAVVKPAFLPKVTVCITHFNRPQFLPMAIQSVLEQDYSLDNVEVVVIDDGSTDPDAINFIATLQEQFKHRDWQVVQTENKYLGAARNTAARIARGEYLLFLDDDNIAHSKQLSTYVSVALATGAELLTASHDVFSGNSLPDFSANTNILTRSVPLGPAATVGLFKNCFGDANFFIKRETFIASGGFTEEKGVGAEDYEFLAKVVLSGVHLEAIPEALLYYRMHNTTEQMLFKTNAVENQVRSARPYASVLNPEDPEATSVLKALAQRRARAISSADVTATCNITVNSVTPNQFSTLTAVKLNFSSLALDVDCEISSILVGSYPCTSITIGSKTSFTCLTAIIPIPGTYSISVTFAGDASVFYTGIYVEVTAPSRSSVLVGALFKADTGIYTTFEALFSLFASIAGVDRSWFTLVVDTHSTSQISTFALENHQMQLSISSNVASLSAMDVFQNLAVAVQTQTSKFSAIGVTIQDFFLMATCDASGDCDCAPNYAPPTCTTKALCPNNCTGNGDCVDGNLGRVCSCHSGYTGRDCSIVSCKNGCSGHGSCVLQTSSAVCLCDSGWNGDACDIASCPNNCNNVGQCVNGTCSCPPGSSGADCSGTENSLVGEQGNPQQKDNTVLAVVVSVVGAIFLIVVGLIIYIVIERRRR